jgi:hypothetical protein
MSERVIRNYVWQISSSKLTKAPRNIFNTSTESRISSICLRSHHWLSEAHFRVTVKFKSRKLHRDAKPEAARLTERYCIRRGEFARDAFAQGSYRRSFMYKHLRD